MHYFAYGSNMLKSRLEEQHENRGTETIGPVIDKGVATLIGHELLFNKLSTAQDGFGSGKANIIPSENKEVLGVLYDLSGEQIDLLTKIEKGYEPRNIFIILNGKQIESATFFAKEGCTKDGLFPTTKYRGYIIEGAEKHLFPENYVEYLKSIPVDDSHASI